jgi:hypothetical protein
MRLPGDTQPSFADGAAVRGRVFTDLWMDRTEHSLSWATIIHAVYQKKTVSWEHNDVS